MQSTWYHNLLRLFGGLKRNRGNETVNLMEIDTNAKEGMWAVIVFWRVFAWSNTAAKTEEYERYGRNAGRYEEEN